MVVAERLRQQISKLVVEWEDKQLNAKVSLGICKFSKAIPTYETWIDCADSALYKAKAMGRKCCVLAQTLSESPESQQIAHCKLNGA